MFQKALICTNLTDGLYRLVRFLPSLAHSGLQQITFLHTVPLKEEATIPREDPEKIERARSRLSPALQNIPQGVEVKVEVISANKPHEAILKTAKTQGSDLIILGASIHSLLETQLFGSTSRYISQHAEIPLMVLRPQLVSTYTEEELDLRCQHLFRYLMIPYDGSEAAQYLTEQIQTHFQKSSSPALQECLLIRVIDLGGRKQFQREEVMITAQKDLEAVAKNLTQLGLNTHTEIRQGEPILELLDAAVERDISAIAISSNRGNKFLECSIPSLGDEVLRQSWHPVIYFPPRRK